LCSLEVKNDFQITRFESKNKLLEIKKTKICKIPISELHKQSEIHFFINQKNICRSAERKYGSVKRNPSITLSKVRPISSAHKLAAGILRNIKQLIFFLSPFI